MCLLKLLKHHGMPPGKLNNVAHSLIVSRVYKPSHHGYYLNFH